MFYNKRVKLFVIITGLLMLIPIARLVQLQFFSGPTYLSEIERLQQGRSEQTQTIRGNILDRNGLIIAAEVPIFKLYVTYDKVTCYADPNIQAAIQMEARRSGDAKQALAEVNQEIAKGKELIAYLLLMCEEYGYAASEIEQKIHAYNQDIWNQRMFQAWRNNCRNTALYLENENHIGSTPGDLARKDFIRSFPDPNDQIRLITDPKYNILEMYSFYPLIEIHENHLFDAEKTLLQLDAKGVEITAQASRNYPYQTAAAQLIGWVGPATQESDFEIFEDERLAQYQDGELCGRGNGIEYVCEPILRGKRGELVYDIDKKLVDHTEKTFGQNVYLTLDIELQQEIETYLMNHDFRSCCDPGKAVVVLDVQSNEILAMVSVPVFNLNTARYDYNKLKEKPYPMRNRCLSEHYPPGSVAKPLVAVAALESGVITAQESIACLSTPPPSGWPRCLVQRVYHTGHDVYWPGQNNVRNAIRGSCNIYFSRVAERMDVNTLRAWFMKFGYGQTIPLTEPIANLLNDGFEPRTLRQVPGNVLSRPGSRRLAGIGQGTMLVTPLQVANSMATLARNGQFLYPSLFQMNTDHSATSHTPTDTGISQSVMNVILDGMHAVVYESHGSAKTEFSKTDFDQYGVKVYGKTGSTEAPENAWFAGFAQDRSGRAVAISVLVEGGESGGTDAAPVARDILEFCVLHGYLGIP